MQRSVRTLIAGQLLPAVVLCLLTIAAVGVAAGPKPEKVRRPLASDAEQANPEDEPPEKIVKTEAQWRKLLTAEQFEVTRQKGTEAPFSGAYWQTKKDGLYRCVCCGQDLFDSRTKFESETGWPSFWQPLKQQAVEYHEDYSGSEPRVEVTCSRCDAHLGHVFRDGPPPTGSRFCMNSAALQWVNRQGKTAKELRAEKTAARKQKRP